jgi:hypothetical protein
MKLNRNAASYIFYLSFGFPFGQKSLQQEKIASELIRKAIQNLQLPILQIFYNKTTG